MDRLPPDAVDPRRKSVRRTVLWLALAAAAVYGAFLLGGYLGFAGGRS
jgi:hypothetical protein